MQHEQVVKVHGARFGSGYLIAPRLVLTAAHLVAPRGEVAVSLQSAGTKYAGVVRAHGGESLDAALVEITAEDWTPPSTLQGHFGRVPQRWGRCVTGGQPVPVAAMGFPRQERVDERRYTLEMHGDVRPHGRAAPHEILDPHSPVGYPEGTSTPWSGMSGAAVFPQGEDLLLGVVIEDRRPDHGTRLTATRAEELLVHDDFRTVIHDATGVDPRLEPVELTGLLKEAPPLNVHSTSMLLRADAEVVEFHGRQDVLDVLKKWCRTPGPPSVRVLTGPGGQGKTRLARELMARLRAEGWVTGEVLGEPGDLRVLRAVQHPLLLVVDYAESRPKLVRRLQDETGGARHPVRLLLLARSRGSWETTATGHLREIPLHALSPDATDRDEVFRLAAQGFAQRLADGLANPDVDWVRLAEALPATRPATRAETALTVQMAALLALLRKAADEATDEATDDEGPLEKRLLTAHESNYWAASVANRRIRDMDLGLLQDAVAAAVLCPVSTKEEAMATIARLMPRETLVDEVALWLRDLYPSPEGRYWGQLEPDRLGEYLAAEKIIADPGLLRRLFAEAPDHQRVQTLTVLARAAVAHANEDRDAEAAEVVAQLRAVLHVDGGRPLTAAMLRAHSDALPTSSHVLRDYALDVARELSGLCEDTGDEPAARRDRAWALHNLADRHLAVGDWAAAVTAAGEAARLREELAADEEMTSRTEWAESLLELSRALRRTGRLAEAHRKGDQALDMFRALAAKGGAERDKRERGLVRALINQAQVVWRLDPATIRFDQITRSDEYTEEALRRARDLADRNADLDPSLLTDALGQRSDNLWRLRRPPEALAPSEEAARTARQLMSENPDSYAFAFADALMALAVYYNAVSRPRDESIALEEEVIELLRPLARELPEVYRSTLAQTLSNLALDLCDERQYEAATRSVGEAIELRRAAARNPHGLGMPELAAAVSVLGDIHAYEENHQEAVERYRESLEIYARSAVPLSAGQLSGMAGTAFNLALSYESLGRTTDAMAAANQAGAIRRRLNDYGPRLFSAGYANTLGNLSGLYRRQDRRIEERIVLRHALSLRRRLARDSEDEREGLADCLANLGSSYRASWPTVGRAVSALTEAYRLYDELPDKDSRQLENLAFTCQELATAYLMLGGFPDAVRFAEHEVRLRRELHRAHPERDEQFLFFALYRLATNLTHARRPAAGWRTAVAAEELCYTLVEQPGRPPAEAASLLVWLARMVSLCGRHDPRLAGRAVEPARRGARIYRRLVDRDPNLDNMHNLSWAVGTLAAVLTSLGRHAEAAQAQLSKGA